MQIAIFQRNEQATLSIECTMAGRQALSSDELSVRERQLLLLLDRHSDLSVQAVTHLLQKIDINTLANKGLINYQLSTQTQLGKSTAIINQHINVKFVNSVDKKNSGKKLKTFLHDTAKQQSSKKDGIVSSDDIYSDSDLDPAQMAAIEQEIQAAINDEKRQAKLAKSAPSISVPRRSATSYQSFGYEPVHESFEDIMIAQSLLDEK